MIQESIECQHYANCGGCCETSQEVDMALCENCLDAYYEREAEQANTDALKVANAALLILVQKLAEEVRQFTESKDYHCCVAPPQMNCRGCSIDALLADAEQAICVKRTP